MLWRVGSSDQKRQVTREQAREIQGSITGEGEKKKRRVEAAPNEINFTLNLNL